MGAGDFVGAPALSGEAAGVTVGTEGCPSGAEAPPVGHPRAGAFPGPQREPPSNTHGTARLHRGGAVTVTCHRHGRGCDGHVSPPGGGSCNGHVSPPRGRL